MQGTMMTIRPGEALDSILLSSVRTFTRSPNLDELHDTLGGYLEVVPYFDSILDGGGVMQTCVAFCDEDGKRKGLKVNEIANALWRSAMRRNGCPGVSDVLVGTVLVLFGDDQFMASL